MSSPWSGVSLDFLTVGDWAIGQGANAPDRQLFRVLLRDWLDDRPEQSSLLEIGPGSGIDLEALRDEGLIDEIDYLGYDFTPEFIEYLRVQYPAQRFEVKDVLELEDEQIADVVWARHVLEHVTDGELALRNLWRSTRGILLVSWFIRPTWSEAQVRCVEQAGFLHHTYSARRMIDLANELDAHLHRFDFDHHSNRASVWLLSREPVPTLVSAAHQFLASSEFLRTVVPAPPESRDRVQAIVDVMQDVTTHTHNLIDVAKYAKPPRADYVDGEGVTPVLKQVSDSQRALERAQALILSERPLDRHNRLVFWGFTTSMDSMRHIFRHFMHAATTMGKDVIHVDDREESLSLLQEGDLVFAVDVEGHALRAHRGVHYVLHNFDISHPVWTGLEDHQVLRLQVYTKDADQYGSTWGPVRRYDHGARTLFQPWGTDLLREEFYDPIFNDSSNQAAFVGAIWDDGGLGNANVIDEVIGAVEKHGLTFRHLTQVPDEDNVNAVRESRIAPAIAGAWQVDKNYLPCRVFKNVSYGALAITNVPKFREILAGCSLHGNSAAELVDEAMGLPERDYLELVAAQQQMVLNYTYRESLQAIGRAIEEGK